MKIGILALATLLCGCAFNLGAVKSQASRNADQQQLDTLTCQDTAQKSIQTAGHQAGQFALGLTVIGTPYAIHLEHKKARKVFTECMGAKGYTVVKNY
ncbi:MAG: hypothetical protein JWO52_3333 [Gammaproteobacteria bacterium]|nr:hypothetical protein [Gammaproteobacteria bacterium]